MDDRYLFKAKRVDNREWVQGSYLYDYGRNIHYIFANENVCPNYINDCRKEFFLQGYEVDPSTICQCLGCEDKNENFIWENDIVRGKMHGNYGYRKLVGVVQYYIDAFKVNIEPNSFSVYKNIPDTCEVIGNIFDNPELVVNEN